MSIEVYTVYNDPVKWKKDLLAAPIGTEIVYIWKRTATPYSSSPQDHRFKKVQTDLFEGTLGGIYHVESFSCGRDTDTTGWAVVRKINVVEELD